MKRHHPTGLAIAVTAFLHITPQNGFVLFMAIDINYRNKNP